MRASQEELARYARRRDRDARQDLITFQLASSTAGSGRCGRRPGEDVELAALRQVLASAERVERLCAEELRLAVRQRRCDSGGLGGVWRRVAELAALDPQFKPYLDARDGIKSQLEDLAAFLRSYADGIEASPASSSSSRSGWRCSSA
jgi:DNA repair ATPase RecN